MSSNPKVTITIVALSVLGLLVGAWMLLCGNFHLANHDAAPTHTTHLSPSAKSEKANAQAGTAQEDRVGEASKASSEAAGASVVSPETSKQSAQPVDTRSDPGAAQESGSGGSGVGRASEIPLSLFGDGVTRADVQRAQQEMKARGFPASHIEDPALVRQFVGHRNVETMIFSSVELPDTASANEAVPFIASGTMPDPSFTFESWDVRVKDRDIVVRPLGSRSGQPVAAVVVPVQFAGEIPGLSPGEYNVHFVGLGSKSFDTKLTIR